MHYEDIGALIGHVGANPQHQGTHHRDAMALMWSVSCSCLATSAVTSTGTMAGRMSAGSAEAENT